nr:Retrovirus-related Pol polyprotein from transposon TNT 1-94 [Ipomoea batatas]
MCFTTFHAIAEGQGEQIFMGNDNMSEVRGVGTVEIKLCFGKYLFLSNVIYVPSLRRNLVSGPLLVRAGIKLVFESEQLGPLLANSSRRNATCVLRSWRAGAAGDDGDGMAFGLSEGGASLEIEIFRDRVGEE